MKNNIGQDQAVTLLVPMRNEQRYLPRLLRSIAASSHPPKLMEILIVDGMSDDDSIEIINNFKKSHTQMEIKIIQNEKITIPYALNTGIRNARHEIIIRMDCHAEYADNYISNSLKNLNSLPNAVGVGGVITPVGISSKGQAIALALSSRLGNGGASYRASKSAIKSDTIWCGCWKKENVIKAGLFNTALEANEDFEFHQRLRQYGDLYTCPDIKAKQYVREEFSALFLQYFRYGFWKATVVKKQPSTLHLRQILPIAFFTTLIISIGLVNKAPWLVSFLLLGYACCVLLAPFLLRNKKKSQIPYIMMSLVVMHVAWYIGFVKGMLKHSKLNTDIANNT